MKIAVDLHIAVITLMLGSFLLLLSRFIPICIGVSVLAVVPQFPLLTRCRDEKEHRVRYLVVNELIIIGIAGVYLATRQL